MRNRPRRAQLACNKAFQTWGMRSWNFATACETRCTRCRASSTTSIRSWITALEELIFSSLNLPRWSTLWMPSATVRLRKSDACLHKSNDWRRPSRRARASSSNRSLRSKILPSKIRLRWWRNSSRKKTKSPPTCLPRSRKNSRLRKTSRAASTAPRRISLVCSKTRRKSRKLCRRLNRPSKSRRCKRKSSKNPAFYRASRLGARS
mmetsp:Transcript_5498/g.21472  ORF Transcript_5498/g.21472 Transcript_5498/m.21472 type:complete len:206 (+) Transcript_5498:1478-2095(+)